MNRDGSEDSLGQLVGVQPHSMTAARAPEAPVDPLFLRRWSTRAFRPNSVSADEIASLFEAARWAPSASNAQPWLFVYASDEETLCQVRPILCDDNRRWADRAPLLVFVFARRASQRTGKPSRTAAFDTGAAWLSIALQAVQLGLTAHAMAGVHHERAYEILRVPEALYDFLAAVAIGRPGEPSDLPADLGARERPSGRRSQREFVFKGRFQPELG